MSSIQASPGWTAEVAVSPPRGLPAPHLNRGGGRRRLRDGQWVHVKDESVNSPHDYKLTHRKLGRRDRVPEFAVHEDFAMGQERCLRYASFAYHALGASHDFLSPGLQGHGH